MHSRDEVDMHIFCYPKPTVCDMISVRFITSLLGTFKWGEDAFSNSKEAMAVENVVWLASSPRHSMERRGKREAEKREKYLADSSRGSGSGLVWVLSDVWRRVVRWKKVPRRKFFLYTTWNDKGGAMFDLQGERFDLGQMRSMKRVQSLNLSLFSSVNPWTLRLTWKGR